MSQQETAQRLLIRFGADGPLKYVSHLDLMRVWERVCKRAGLPLASSQGFSPRPKIALAAPLAVGVTSEAELLDLQLTSRVELAEARRRLSRELTPGLQIDEISERPLKGASLQSMLSAVRYSAEVSDPRSNSQWQADIAELLAQPELPWTHQRGKESKTYDLRPLILGLELISVCDRIATLHMHLRNDERGAGRPDQVLLALGATAEPARMHRTAIELSARGVPA